MTRDPGAWTIFHGAGAALILGTPWGRQFASGSSREWAPSMRESNSALAHGWNGTSSGLRSAAMFLTYLAPSGSQIPDRSGLPSADRGRGAERFAVPSAVRGTPVRGILVHCADNDVDIKNKANSAAPTDDERFAFTVTCILSSQRRRRLYVHGEEHERAINVPFD